MARDCEEKTMRVKRERNYSKESHKYKKMNEAIIYNSK